MSKLPNFTNFYQFYPILISTVFEGHPLRAHAPPQICGNVLRLGKIWKAEVDKMNDGLRRLIEKHIATLRREGAELVSILQSETPDIEAARRLAHTLKGSAGSLGFSAYSSSCQEIESQCKALLASGKTQWQTSWEAHYETLSEVKLEDSELYKGNLA